MKTRMLLQKEFYLIVGPMRLVSLKGQRHLLNSRIVNYYRDIMGLGRCLGLRYQ
jgi:hypothetical protein